MASNWPGIDRQELTIGILVDPPEDTEADRAKGVAMLQAAGDGPTHGRRSLPSRRRCWRCFPPAEWDRPGT